MPPSRHIHSTIQHTPAKINLSLEVLGKRTDGFHELATMMTTVRLNDTLVLERTDESMSLSLIDGTLAGNSSFSDQAESHQFQDVPTNDENLVIRALKLLQEVAGINEGVHVQLVKRIPSQAGLGGGSSDAAAALVAGNRLWDLGYDTQTLAALGAKLGSDVPFFVYNLQGVGQNNFRRPGLALCHGRGEQISPLPVRYAMPCVLIKPTHGMSTPEVYQAVEEQDYFSSGDNSEALRKQLLDGAWPHLGSWVTNSLQAAALRVYPELQNIIDAFKKIPVLCHQLSGSGSAYFGICRTLREARRAAAMLRAEKLGTIYVTSTC